MTAHEHHEAAYDSPPECGTHDKCMRDGCRKCCSCGATLILDTSETPEEQIARLTAELAEERKRFAEWVRGNDSEDRRQLRAQRDEARADVLRLTRERDEALRDRDGWQAAARTLTQQIDADRSVIREHRARVAWLDARQLLTLDVVRAAVALRHARDATEIEWAETRVHAAVDVYERAESEGRDAG